MPLPAHAHPSPPTPLHRPLITVPGRPRTSMLSAHRDVQQQRSGTDSSSCCACSGSMPPPGAGPSGPTAAGAAAAAWAATAAAPVAASPHVASSSCSTGATCWLSPSCSCWPRAAHRRGTKGGGRGVGWVGAGWRGAHQARATDQRAPTPTSKWAKRNSCSCQPFEHECSTFLFSNSTHIAETFTRVMQGGPCRENALGLSNFVCTPHLLSLQAWQPAAPPCPGPCRPPWPTPGRTPRGAPAAAPQGPTRRR